MSKYCLNGCRENKNEVCDTICRVSPMTVCNGRGGLTSTVRANNLTFSGAPLDTRGDTSGER